MTRYLKVDAEGNWRFEIKPLLSARQWPGGEAAGTGADVLLYTGAAGILDYSNDGDSNFIVYGYGSSGSPLLVNEIGPIQGSTTIQAGPMLVTVEADGGWVLTSRAP